MSAGGSDPSTWARVEELFHAALERAPDERGDWLDEACGTDTSLRARVDELLGVESKASEFFESSPALDTLPVTLSHREMSGKRLGGFRLVRLIARGGMGSVYEAQQDEPRRRVALKVLHRAQDEDWRRRFRLEARILAHLRHPGIAQVHDAGIDDGVPWFAMEFIEGSSITRYVRDAGLPTHDRLELFARVCDAVHHAHLKGVIHRDLKPANILVDRDGRPKVVDFGLARANADEVDSSVFETNAGVIFGTMPYMSPEQADAGEKLVDLRSDVYALGAVLYEILADRPAFPMGDLPLHERLAMIREKTPPRLGAFSRELAGDVEIIAEKAMDKVADRRYGSASELAADVRRHLSHQPILARAPSAAYQVAKFARRNRVLVTVSAGALLLLIVFSVAVTSLLFDARRSARAERAAKKNEADQRERAEDALEEAALVNEALQRVFLSSSSERGLLHDVKLADLLDFWRESLDMTFADRPGAGISAMRMLGSMYRAIGRYDVALEILEEAAATGRDAHGLEHQETLFTLTELAVVQEVLGQLSRAEHNARVVHAIRERIEPDGHRDAFRNVAVLAKILVDAHRYDEAEKLIRRFQDRLPDGNPRTIMLSLAHICETTGRLDEADAILEELDRGLHASLGDDPAVHLGTRCQQASVALARGDFDRALEIAAKARRVSRDFRGAEHRQTIELDQIWIAATLCTGDMRGAVENGAELVARCAAAFGDGHEQTIRARTTLAVSYYRLGHLGAAHEILDRAISAADDALPPLDSIRLRCVEYMIRIHLARSRYELAEDLGEEVIQALDASDEPVTSQGISVRRAYATALQREDRFDEAAAVLRRALELTESVRGFQNGERLRVLNDLAAVHYISGALTEAEPLMRRVVEIRETELGEGHPHTVGAMNNLGMVLLKMGRLEEAEKLLSRSIELSSPPHRDETADLGAYCHGLGQCLMELERYDEAERVFRRSLDLFERFETGGFTMRRACWKMLVDLYERQGRESEAGPYRKLLGID